MAGFRTVLFGIHISAAAGKTDGVTLLGVLRNFSVRPAQVEDQRLSTRLLDGVQILRQRAAVIFGGVRLRLRNGNSWMHVDILAVLAGAGRTNITSGGHVRLGSGTCS